MSKSLKIVTTLTYKLRMLRWGDYPESSGWDQWTYKGPNKWEAGKSEKEILRQDGKKGGQEVDLFKDATILLALETKKGAMSKGIMTTIQS
jgi:hypothetical protein